MHQPWDQMGKEVLGALFAELGRVEREREVTSRVQRVDLWVEPDERAVKAVAEARASYFGLVARMAALGPLIVEVFSRSPSVAAVESCVREQLALAGDGRKPRLWIVSSGRPRRVLEAFEARPMAGWPPGFYTQRPQEAMHVVVVSELPETVETLVLRLVGRRGTLARAVREVRQLAAADAWIRRRLEPPLLAFLHWIGHHQDEMQSAKIPADYVQLYREWEREVRAESEARGEARGVTQGVTQAVLAVLEARGWEVEPGLAARVRACRDADQLDTWLRRAATASSLDEVFTDH